MYILFRVFAGLNCGFPFENLEKLNENKTAITDFTGRLCVEVVMKRKLPHSHISKSITDERNADDHTNFSIMFMTVQKCWVCMGGLQSFQMRRCSFLRNRMFYAVTVLPSCSSADRAPPSCLTELSRSITDSHMLHSGRLPALCTQPVAPGCMKQVHFLVKSSIKGAMTHLNCVWLYLLPAAISKCAVWIHS